MLIKKLVVEKDMDSVLKINIMVHFLVKKIGGIYHTIKRLNGGNKIPKTPEEQFYSQESYYYNLLGKVLQKDRGM